VFCDKTKLYFKYDNVYLLFDVFQLFYRVHASILKLLKYSNEDLDYALLEQHLDSVTEQQIYLDIVEVDKACIKGKNKIVTWVTKQKENNDFSERAWYLTL